MIEKDEDEFSFFEVDLDRLDYEWVQQPKLYFKYAKKLAEAREVVDRKKAALELADAELDKDIREAPEKFGLSKLTEPSIKQCILAHELHVDAQRRLYKAKHSLDVIQAAVTALDHRKKALEKLVDLRLADYFSEPKPSRKAKERMDEVKTVSRMGKGIKRRD